MAELERRLGAGASGDAGGAQPGAQAEPSAAGDPEVIALLREGKEVQATALLYKQRGSSLTEAKAEVDRLKAQLSL